MNARYEKYKDQGLVILGVSNESGKLLDGFAKQFDVKFPIVSSTDAGNAYGIRGYPTHFLVSTSGKILSSGHFGDAEIEAALKSVVQFPAIPEGSSRLAQLRKAVEANHVIDVARSLTRAAQIPDLAAEEKAAVDRVQTFFQRLCKATVEEIAAMKGPNYQADVERLEEIGKDFKGLPVADDAKAKLDAFRKDKKIKAELTAMKRLAMLRKKYDANKISQRKKLLAALEKFVKTDGGTYAATKAQAILDAPRR